MGAGWHEWPLMLFTVTGQFVVGGMIVIGLALISGKLTEREARAVHGSMLFLWLLIGAAFAASLMHLGTPLRAFNSLNRIGESALSNEVAAGLLFSIVGGLYWLLAMVKKMPQALGRVWLVVTMLLGLLFVYAMTRVYQVETVPTWHSGYTTINFLLSMLIGGPLLGALLLRAAGLEVGARNQLILVSVFAVLLSLAVALLQTSELAMISSSVQQASALIPAYGQLMVWRLVLLVLGLSCWIFPQLHYGNVSVLGLLLGLILLFAGELLGRALFYGLHMTVGVSVGS
ncbi:DmsC/YnfH family molybdoenzyme membrane anchor subunit [Serratia microhaemolytica]|uniref:DmsC/YnfH family molybdoenzyme membrane anchor subunit n=1 Tax=Serratia microhaemolytica TaxID=2675110 RepID=UPI000FDEECF6|nr:DmsC/YnfH family molybdoenzyme membrane anchor subunit [Serratia microhaemolytica]